MGILDGDTKMSNLHSHTVCRKCGKQFGSSTKLFDHIKIEHAANVKNNDLHRCAVCGELMMNCNGHILDEDIGSEPRSTDIGYRQDMTY